MTGLWPVILRQGKQLYLRDMDALGKAVFYCPAAVADARRAVSGIELKFLTAFLRVILAACLLLTARINFAAVPSLLMQACCFKMPAKSG